MNSNADLLARAHAEIDMDKIGNKISEHPMLLADLCDEIQRQNVNAQACSNMTERLLRWINEANGDRIRVVREAA